MTNNVPVRASNLQTQSSTGDETVSQVVKECLKIIEDFGRSTWRSINRASATHDLIDTLTSSTPELTELEFNDTLGTYLSMLEQHSLNVGDTGVDREHPDQEEEEGNRSEEHTSELQSQ